MDSLPPRTTLSHVLLRLEADGQLDIARKREFRGAVRTLSRILSRPAEGIGASLAEIDTLLREAACATSGCSTKTIRNTRSRIRAALEHAANGRKTPPYGLALTPEWAALAAKLTERRFRIGLSRLIRFASFRGVAPPQVTDAFLDEVVENLRPIKLGRDVNSFRRTTVSLWNEATTTIAGWPPGQLTARVEVERNAHFAVGAFPASFQQELNAYLSWAAGGDRLSDSAPKIPLKPRTLRLRREQLKIAGSTLAKAVGDPAHVTSLAMLVSPANAKLILTRFLGQSGQPPTAFVAGLATTLLAVGRHWVKPGEGDLDQLVRMKRRLALKNEGLTVKNRRVLRQFSDRELLNRLLRLPGVLAAHARGRGLSPSRSLQRMQIALAIELLLHAPMRLQNLSTLRLDQQLQWPCGRGGTVFITLLHNETKNGSPQEYPIDGESKALLHEYLDDFRALGVAQNAPWLFIRRNGVPVTADALRDGITKAVLRELGVEMTPHQFRHLAAMIALDAQPGAIGLVKDLLGHRNIKTTVNFYAGMRTRQAAQEYDKILTAHRQPPGA